MTLAEVIQVTTSVMTRILTLTSTHPLHASTPSLHTSTPQLSPSHFPTNTQQCTIQLLDQFLHQSIHHRVPFFPDLHQLRLHLHHQHAPALRPHEQRPPILAPLHARDSPRGSAQLRRAQIQRDDRHLPRRPAGIPPLGPGADSRLGGSFPPRRRRKSRDSRGATEPRLRTRFRGRNEPMAWRRSTPQKVETRKRREPRGRSANQRRR